MAEDEGRSDRERCVSDDAVHRFRKLNVWENGDSRAPHKPLLALWAIGRCLKGKERLVTYKVVEKEVGALLQRFGPVRQRVRPDYPFWHLQNDCVWEIDRPHLVGTTSKGDAWVEDLKRERIRGGFKSEVFRVFQQDRRVALGIAESLVAAHFPLTIHDSILEATSIPAEMSVASEVEQGVEYVISRRRRRDPAFRGLVLAAYSERCAVCAFGGRLDDKPLALEAAHIKWHEADGPSVVRNGLALCALHHKLFDAGTFTLVPELKIRVARKVSGAGVEDALRRYDGETLVAPPEESPSLLFLDWHRREVFKEPNTDRQCVGRCKR